MIKVILNNKETEIGPFDIIGDIHGCYDELCELLSKMEYIVDKENMNAYHLQGRKIIFLGDLCDRGDKNTEVLKIVMNMVNENNAYCVIGNHDLKLLKKLNGVDVQINHGFDKTIEQINKEEDKFIQKVKMFIGSLTEYYIFDYGKLVVAHAGIKEKYQGEYSERVRSFCLYGDTTGEIDQYGLPIRLPWAKDYRGVATVVYGHTPNVSVQNINNTYCIDTGCVFGGKLTALRYPEKKIIQVEAKKEYYKPIKPFKDSN